MLKTYSRLSRFVLLATLPIASTLFAKHASAGTIVACIGEQTTFTKDNAAITADLLWPGVLGTLLGSAYTVGNDTTNNGLTVTGQKCVSAASTAGPPAIVVIGPFAEHDYVANTTQATWQAEYQKVVNLYLALTPKPTVYVMTPPPAAFVYQKPEEQTFASMVVKPAVLAVAAATPGVHVIDLFDDNSLATGAGDGHFTAVQHARVAELAKEAILGSGSAGGAGGANSSGAGGASAAAGSGGASAGSTGTAGSPGAATGGTSSAAAGTGGALTGAGGTGNSGGGSAPVTGSAGSVAAVAGSVGSPSAPSSSGDSGGCTIALGSAPRFGTAWLALVAGALLLRRRRSSGLSA